MSIGAENNGAYDADNEVTPQSRRLMVQSSDHDIALGATIGPFEVGEKLDTKPEYHLFNNSTLAAVTNQAHLTAQRAALAWDRAGEHVLAPQRKVDAQYAAQDSMGSRPNQIHHDQHSLNKRR